MTDAPKPWADLDRDELLALLDRLDRQMSGFGFALHARHGSLSREILEARYDVAIARSHAAERAVWAPRDAWLKSMSSPDHRVRLTSKLLAESEKLERAYKAADAKAKRLRKKTDALWDELYPPERMVS
ncbi:hypothetical protein [Methylobrevis pamukkalensis]|uniref:Uncharacterized protein n=1 Tax=Methylobrevis pamukkalensis TaxID=1439726 RepID=A0A1E3H4E8_9HYPH|nr:hypothetical protein [Methylobrevis pamukkalensis]ODN71199.1 hypothetical protein A6302_01488 [Methylobrevis pamukkalensis]